LLLTYIRPILLFILDVSTLVVSYAIAAALFYSFFDDQVFSWANFRAVFGLEFAILFLCQISMMLLLRGYDFSRRMFRARRLVRRISGLLSGTIIGITVLVTFLFVQDIHRLVILVVICLVMPGLALASVVRSRLMEFIEGSPSTTDQASRKGTALAKHFPRQDRVMILGDGENASVLWKAAQQIDGQPLKLVGFVNSGGGGGGGVTPDQDLASYQLPRSDKSLLDIAHSAKADEIIIAADEIEDLALQRELLDCRMQGISIIDANSFLEREVGRLNINSSSFEWLIFSPGFQRRGHYYTLKRCVDLLVSAGLLVLASPMMLLLIALVRLDSRGSAFFKQTRVGLDGAPFLMYKFRTMRQDAEADGVARWATQNDSRITRIGKYLRMTRLDELPQLINVLKGEMSMVGPRPERPEFVVELDKEIPFYTERHRVMPGITGWAQTNFDYTSSIEDTKIKLEYDLYVKNCSLYLDFLVFLQTIRVAIRGEGAR